MDSIIMNVQYVVWTDVKWTQHAHDKVKLAGYCEHCNEQSSHKTAGKFLEQWTCYWVLKDIFDLLRY